MFDKNLPVLLAVERSGSNLTLRLDTDSLAQQGDAACIVLFELSDCSNIEEAQRTLREGIGQVIYYDTASFEENELWIFIDYERLALMVICKHWHETTTHYIETDLISRSRHIAAWYAAQLKQHDNLDQQYRHLRNVVNMLEKDVEQQVDRLQRRLTFFQKVNPAKAESAKACIKVYKHVAALIDQYK